MYQVFLIWQSSFQCVSKNCGMGIIPCGELWMIGENNIVPRQKLIGLKTR